MGYGQPEKSMAKEVRNIAKSTICLKNQAGARHESSWGAIVLQSKIVDF